MQLNPNKNTPDKDIVFTPPELALDIITHYNPTGLLLDPSKGDGAFYNYFPEGSDWCEISEGRDFFEYDRKCDWIITNPPWSLMRRFLQHAMTLADNIVYLTSINHYTTKARLRDMRAADFGIKEFYCFDTPKCFPQSGFQLAAVHTQRDYDGDIALTFSPSFSS
tara:strand:+ start:339 stop:833 length:495 start_codon:yes stop_codon:yes gene_type:complete